MSGEIKIHEETNAELRPLIRLDDTTRLVVIKKMLLAISVITGWPLPEAEMLAMLVEQFERKILETYGYREIDCERFLAVFRARCSDINNYGAPVCLALIDRVVCDALPKKVMRYEDYFIGADKFYAALDLPKTDRWGRPLREEKPEENEPPANEHPPTPCSELPSQESAVESDGRFFLDDDEVYDEDELF